jgi:hypothetical protein
MDDDTQTERRRAGFEEAQRLIEGSRRTLEQTRELLNRSDRLLRENPIVLYPAKDESPAEEFDTRKHGNRQ